MEHAHHVAGEDRFHRRIGEAEVAHEAVEVVRAALGLGRGRREGNEIDAARRVLAAGEVHAVARRHVLDDLPAVDIVWEAAGALIERRRRSIADPARQSHEPLLALHRRGELGDRGRADGAGMHIGEMRDVEHVVGDELVVAFHVDLLGLRVRPFAMVGPPPVRDQRGVGALGRAHPDPQPSVALDERIGANARLRRHARLPGDLGTAPVRREAQPMVAAAQLVAFEPAHRQRQVAVAAAIFQRDRCAVFAAIEHDRLVQQQPRERLARHLGCTGGDVPGAAQEHATTALWPAPPACAPRT